MTSVVRQLMRRTWSLICGTFCILRVPHDAPERTGIPNIGLPHSSQPVPKSSR